MKMQFSVLPRNSVQDFLKKLDLLNINFSIYKLQHTFYHLNKEKTMFEL